MEIVVGTKNPAKIEAIKQGVNRCTYINQKEVEFIAEAVDSGVSDMPTSLEENMIGAKNRSLNLQKKHPNADFCIGMEGGTSYFQDKAYLFGIVYICNSKKEGHFGISNMMEVPEVFSKRIYENNEELGVVLEELTGIEGVSKKNGAFGVWSDDNLTRIDQFVYAFLSAIPPFYNCFYRK